jgi:preprotein translocase subunit SecB
MAEEQVATEKQFSIQKIYTKDMSFETPNSPQIFTEQWEPSVDFNLGSNVQPLENGLYEVALAVTITVKSGEKIAYLVEVNQAGIFTLAGFSDEEMGPMVGSFCPNILFPYAREAITDLVTKGGFPQLLLAPVNFDALYAQHIQAQQQVPSTETIN